VETQATSPLAPYTVSKLAAREQFCRVAYIVYGLETVGCGTSTCSVAGRIRSRSTARYGDYIFRDGNAVIALDRHRAAPTYCSGIQVINPAKINEIMSPTEEFDDVGARLIERGELLASRVYPTSWFSADTVLQLEALNQARE